MTQAVKVGVVGAVAVLAFAVAPYVYFRSTYAHAKRLREVERGRVYRCGQLTAAGFEEAVARFGIRTVVNLQDDFPDPDVAHSFWGGGTVKESELCRRLGVRYVALAPDLVPRTAPRGERPRCVDAFLTVMDDPSAYPVLVHCKAGLHRTGVLCAVYRMEYQGWDAGRAYRELRDHGFGAWACTAANDYVRQYVLNYQRGQRRRPLPSAADYGLRTTD